MRVLDVVTGIGYGHVIRQAALLDFLKKKNCKFVIATHANGLDYFEGKLPTIDILGPKLPEKSGRLGVAKTLLINFKWYYDYLQNYLKLQTTLRVFKPEIIVCDFEPIGLSLAKELPHFLIFNFDPEIYEEFIRNSEKKFKWQKKYIDTVYNKARKINAPIIIPSLTGERKNKDFCYVNPVVRELPKQSEKDLLKKLKLKKQPIIIMLGGSHFGDSLLHEILSVIKDMDEEFLIFGYKLGGKKHNNVNFLGFKENFLEYLKASKGIITMAGHSTLSECIVLGKPCLMFPIENSIEQLLNAYVMEKHKLGVVNRNFKDDNLKKSILDFINNLKDIEKNLSKFNIKGNGAEQVYNIIKEKSKLE